MLMPDTPFVDYRGLRVYAPFLCLCCGRETPIRQWAYGRTCGLCDTGACNPANRSFRPEYAHAEPGWRRWDARETLLAYAGDSRVRAAVIGEVA